VIGLGGAMEDEKIGTMLDSFAYHGRERHGKYG
jgi:hypothetical protein